MQYMYCACFYGLRMLQPYIHLDLINNDAHVSLCPLTESPLSRVSQAWRPCDSLPNTLEINSLFILGALNPAPATYVVTVSRRTAGALLYGPAALPEVATHPYSHRLCLINTNIVTSTRHPPLSSLFWVLRSSDGMLFIEIRACQTSLGLDVSGWQVPLCSLIRSSLVQRACMLSGSTQNNLFPTSPHGTQQSKTKLKLWKEAVSYEYSYFNYLAGPAGNVVFVCSAWSGTFHLLPCSNCSNCFLFKRATTCIELSLRKWEPIMHFTKICCPYSNLQCY